MVTPGVGPFSREKRPLRGTGKIAIVPRLVEHHQHKAGIEGATARGRRRTMTSTEDDAHRQQALEDVRDALREFAANIIRIVRGAGQPLEVGRQAHAFVAALERSPTSALLLSPEIARILRVDLDLKGPAPVSEEEKAEARALGIMIRAALQLAASRLVSQE